MCDHRPCGTQKRPSGYHPYTKPPPSPRCQVLLDRLEDVAAEARRMLLAVPVPVAGSELGAAQLKEALQILERAQSSLSVAGGAQKAALRRILDAFRGCYQRVLQRDCGAEAAGAPPSACAAHAVCSALGGVRRAEAGE